jgi:hypothetical protein
MAPFDIEQATIGPAMSLLVIERDGSTFRVVEIKSGGDVQQFLRQAWETTRAEIAAAEKVSYSPDVIIRPEEGRTLVVDEDLREDSEVVELLIDPADRPQVRPDEVDPEALYLYAVVSKTKAGRLAMVKKLSPAKRAREGKRWALARNELRLMDDDPWQLHPRFDLVIGDSGAYALSVSAFEQIFAEADRLVADVGSWVNTIAKSLPMDPTQRDVLIQRCKDSSRLRRRLRSIENRGHIKRVTISKVRSHVKAMGLPVSHFVQKGKLVVDSANAGELLQILNEDLFRGGLTDDPFRSEAKEPMP